MIDNGMKGRVKGLLAGPAMIEPVEQAGAHSDAAAQNQALQVLVLAERTAEDHVASARRKADAICIEARATAERIVRDAQVHAHGLQQEAEKTRADAQAAAALIARDAQTKANSAQRNAEKLLSDARVRADDIATKAQMNADELGQQAQQRYDDVVGSLAAKREALQHQIEALELFDRDYRARLTAFLQNQLRTLWVDEPQVDADDLEQSDSTVSSAPARGKKTDPS